MKKVLVFFGGGEISEGAVEFARKLNKLRPLLLVGIFIPQISYVGLMSPMAGTDFIPLVDEEIKEIKENIKRFEKLCKENNIAFRVHVSYADYTMLELKVRTRFSDLFIISSDKFYEHIIGEDPKEYLRDVLHESECPVVIVPEEFDFPTRNIFAYNGSETSVYSIRQFFYLFPEFSKFESTFVYSKEDEDATVPAEGQMKELAEPHLEKFKFMKLEFDPKKYFTTWVADEKYAILVGGSHDRPKIGKIFKKNFFNEVIADHWLPIFVAHK